MIKSSLRPALILYILRVVFATIVVLPVFMSISGRFGGSRLTEDFWPLPHGIAFTELLWQMRELLYIVIPLIFLVMLLYFIALQFLYGGIYNYLWRDDHLMASSFFQSCGVRFRGFIKIAIVGIFAFLIVFLIADLVAIAFSKLTGLIAGEAVATVTIYFIIYLSFYLLGGYMIGLRFIQVRDDNSSLKYAYNKLGTLLAFRLRYFIAVNVIVGTLTFVTLVLSVWLIGLPYKLPYSLPVVILTVVCQQAVIFWIGLAEVIQIQINKRVIKEINYGTEMG
jgi:hypothetical protein